MSRTPALFVSHGAPTFALDPGAAGAHLGRIGRSLDTLAAVLVVSPHWTTRGVRVMSANRPRTLHDFHGFPAALSAIRYPAAGHPRLAGAAIDLLLEAGFDPTDDPSRGFDHGAWVPLLHLRPRADLPVFQVSMPHDLDEAGALRLGRALAPLSHQGVLILGSGALTHNLAEFRLGEVPDAAYAHAFVDWVRRAVVAGDTARLVRAIDDAPHGRRAHPTREHYLPLLVAAGAAGPSRVTVLDGGLRHGVISMESYLFEDDGRPHAGG